MARTVRTPPVCSAGMAASGYRRFACSSHVVAWRPFAGVRCVSVARPIRRAGGARCTWGSADRRRTLSGATCCCLGGGRGSASGAGTSIHAGAVSRSRSHERLVALARAAQPRAAVASPRERRDETSALWHSHADVSELDVHRKMAEGEPRLPVSRLAAFPG